MLHAVRPFTHTNMNHDSAISSDEASLQRLQPATVAALEWMMPLTTASAVCSLSKEVGLSVDGALQQMNYDALLMEADRLADALEGHH